MDPQIYLQGTNRKFRLTQTELGRGQFVEVRLAIGDDQLQYACKEFQPEFNYWSYERMENFFENVKKQRDIMRLCQHQNIIKFIDYIEVQTPQDTVLADLWRTQSKKSEELVREMHFHFLGVWLLGYNICITQKQLFDILTQPTF